MSMKTKDMTLTAWICAVLLGVGTVWQYRPRSDLLKYSQLSTTLARLSEAEASVCQANTQKAFHLGSDPVLISYSTTEHPDVPRLSTSNSTAWEAWEFDGSSSSAKEAVMINFARDPSYHFFGQGNVRVELFIMLDGDVIVQDLDFVEISTIYTCPDTVVGIWSAPGRTYRFEISKNSAVASLKWATHHSKGEVSFNSSSAPLWAHDRSVRMSQALSVAQPIPAGSMKLKYETPSRNVAFQGTGGHSRFWASDGWFKIAAGFKQIRATAGPYVLTYWQHQTRDGNLVKPSAHLFENGELLVAIQDIESTEATDSVVLTDDLAVGNTGYGAPGVSGRSVEFVSPSRNQSWKFQISNQKPMFDMNLGNAKGISGFTALARGGLVGGKLETGAGFVEDTAYPLEFKQWQIWAVYILHIAGGWWRKIQNLI